jgi:hypothetical protein
MATVTLTLNSGAFPSRLRIPQKKAFVGQIFSWVLHEWDLVRLKLLSGLVTNSGKVNCYTLSEQLGNLLLQVPFPLSC